MKANFPGGIFSRCSRAVTARNLQKSVLHEQTYCFLPFSSPSPACESTNLNKTPKLVSLRCVGLWKHNGVLSEFGKIRENGKMCHVMSIDE